MISSISKPKIPKTYSFVLKTSVLNEYLEQNNYSIHIDLVYWMPKEIGSIFEVHFLNPNENFDFSRLYIRAGALPNHMAGSAREKIKMEVFPHFKEWLDTQLNPKKGSTKLNKDPYFNAKYLNENLIIEQE